MSHTGKEKDNVVWIEITALEMIRACTQRNAALLGQDTTCAIHAVRAGYCLYSRVSVCHARRVWMWKGGKGWTVTTTWQ